MFRFLTPKPANPPHPLQTGKTASAWFRQLPTTDVIGRQLHVVRTLDELCRSGRPLEFDNVAAIAFLDAELGADCDQLLAQYVDASNGSGAAAERVWQAACDICAAFIAAYERLLDEALAHGAERRWRQETPRFIVRLVHYFGTDARSRALRAERWIPAKWEDLHRFYRRAIELGVERVPVVGDRPGGVAGTRSIEQEYILVLLTQVVNTGTLAPSQLEWTLAQLRAWSRELTLETTRRPASSFAVDPRGRKGLERCRGVETAEGLRYLDTGPLALQIERSIASLRRPADGAAESAGALAGPRIAILEKLRAMVSPDTARAVSREPRVTVGFDADVRIGLARICHQLGASDLRNLAFEAWTAGANSDAAGVAVPSRIAAAGPGAGSVVAPATRYGETTTWRVQNRSNSGLRITAAGATGDGPALGSLVAVWPRKGGDGVLGVVRRMVKTTSATVDAGVSVIALRFAAVTLHARRHAREDMGFVVDGVDVSTIGEHFDGIYLPPPSRPRQPLTEKSLMIPTSEYADARSVVVITGETVYTLVLRELIERRADWSWVVIEIVGRSGRG